MPDEDDNKNSQTENSPLSFDALGMSEEIAMQISRRGGGAFMTPNGMSGYVPGPNEVEMLHNVCDLLREIRDLLKTKGP